MSSLSIPTSSRRRLAYAAVLIGLIAARLCFAALAYARPHLAIANDSDRYVPIANGILTGEAYKWNTDRPGELLNTVGYPLFLAGVFATLGHGAGDIAVGQLLMTGLAALFLFLVLSRWLGETPAFVSSVTLLLEPLTILWSMTILTESLFAAVVGASAASLGAWAIAPRRGWLVLAGTLAAMACLVRPVGLALLAVWAAAVSLHPTGLRGKGAAPLWARVRRCMVFVLPAVMLIAPWVVRNALLWDCPTLSSVDRVTMRDYVAAKMIVETEHIDLEAAQRRLQVEDPGMCPRASAKYRGMILDDPVTYLRLHAAGTVPVLIATNFDRWLQYFGVSYELPDLWRPYMDGGVAGLLAALGSEARQFPAGLGVMMGLTALQLLIYLMAAIGAWTAWRTGDPAARWYASVLIIGLIVLLVTPGQSGHERFRVPMEPLLAILIGFRAAWGTSSAKKGPTTAPTGEEAQEIQPQWRLPVAASDIMTQC